MGGMGERRSAVELSSLQSRVRGDVETPSPLRFVQEGCVWRLCATSPLHLGREESVFRMCIQHVVERISQLGSTMLLFMMPEGGQTNTAEGYRGRDKDGRWIDGDKMITGVICSCV